MPGGFEVGISGGFDRNIHIVIPEPDHHQVLIRLAPASLNFRDLLNQQDIALNWAGLIPFSDGAGIVAGVGSEVSRWK